MSIFDKIQNPFRGPATDPIYDTPSGATPRRRRPASQKDDQQIGIYQDTQLPGQADSQSQSEARQVLNQPQASAQEASVPAGNAAAGIPSAQSGPVPEQSSGDLSEFADADRDFNAYMVPTVQDSDAEIPERPANAVISYGQNLVGDNPDPIQLPESVDAANQDAAYAEPLPSADDYSSLIYNSENDEIYNQPLEDIIWSRISPQAEAERQEEERRQERQDQVGGAVDALTSLVNLFFTSKGSPYAFEPTASYSSALETQRRKLQDARRQREQERLAWASQFANLGQQRRANFYQDVNYVYKQYADERAQAKADAAARKAQYQELFLLGKIDEQQWKAANREEDRRLDLEDRKIKQNLIMSQISRNNRSGYGRSSGGGYGYLSGSKGRKIEFNGVEYSSEGAALAAATKYAEINKLPSYQKWKYRNFNGNPAVYIGWLNSKIRKK